MSVKDSSALEIAPDEMRRLGYAAVDAPPWKGASRQELEPRFREPSPREPRDADEVLARALEVLRLAGRIDHPRFFAFVPSSPTWTSVLGDLLATGFNVFQGTWLESAGPSQIELVVLDWFREWLAMPEGAGGLFTSGGSAANLTAVVTAREAAAWPERPVVYLSDQAHSSLARACRIAGFRSHEVRTVPTDDGFRMRVDALEAMLAEDRAGGCVPVMIGANGGATNTGAVDPLPALAELAERERVWLHVDAAYGGFAVLTDVGRRALTGIGRAHSVTLDPHKWLFQPYETGCLMVRDPARLEAAFRVLPEYLQDTDLGYEQVNFADRGLQLTRAFRALKVWMSLQMHGVDAHARAIDEAIALTAHAADRVREAPELELLSAPSLGIMCFRASPPGVEDEAALEALNRALQDRIVDEGTAMMSSTRLRGRYALRMCVMNFRSVRRDVDAVIDRVRELATR